MTTAKERIENEMKQLILKAKKLIAEELDSCVDWIDDEKKKSKKLLEQLEKLQRQYPDIDGKIFNDNGGGVDTNGLYSLFERKNSFINHQSMKDLRPEQQVSFLLKENTILLILFFQ